MRFSVIAQPYARALFSWAKQHDKLSACAHDLHRFTQVVEDPQVHKLLTGYRWHADQFLALLVRLLKDPIDEVPSKNLLRLLCHHHHVMALPEIHKHYTQLWQEDEHILSVEVYSAHPLSEQQKSALTAKLKPRYPGKTIKLSCVEEPELLGGVKIRIKDAVIDGSVRRKLEMLRSQFALFTSS